MIGTYLKQNNGVMTFLEMRMEDSGQCPFVIASGQRYNSMAELTTAHPELGASEQLPLYCRICLHFVRGFGFTIIDAPEEFRNRYAALVRHGKASSGDRLTAADFGPFDTSEIGHPKLTEDKLVFYVEDNLYGVPHRVEAPWPDHAQGVVKFLLLPLQE